MPSVTLGSAGSADGRHGVGNGAARVGARRDRGDGRRAGRRRGEATGILGESSQQGPTRLWRGVGLVAGRPGVDLPRVCRAADLCNTLYDPRPIVYARSGEDNNRRKPKFQSVCEGVNPLRSAERAFSGLTPQEPPRTTRNAPRSADSADIGKVLPTA